MEGLSSALAVLTAMITPAVLISVCGTMILSTSTRLALSTIHMEMDFIWRFTKHFAPPELV
jgi:hypothetical protein